MTTILVLALSKQIFDLYCKRLAEFTPLEKNKHLVYLQHNEFQRINGMNPDETLVVIIGSPRSQEDFEFRVEVRQRFTYVKTIADVFVGHR